MNTEEKPNIIFIITDQQRVDTINAHGYEHMTTPNIDRISKNGVNFRRAFCNGATCVPSRAALFTGMYPHNLGVHSFDEWGHHRSWVHDLADNGYHCVNIGKMHVLPLKNRMGFHERFDVENPTTNFLKNGGTDDEWGRYLSLHGEDRPLNRHLKDPKWRGKFQGIPWHMEEHLHSDVFIGNSAKSWIRSHQPSKPLFLEIGFVGPHEPYDPLPRHFEKYRDCKVPKPNIFEGELEEKPQQHQAHQDYNNRTNHESQIAMPEATEEDISEMRRHYYAKVTTVDEKIGEILEILEGKGYLDNALVIFSSDHGDMLGDHKLPYKWLMYDSVVNVPLIVWDTRKNHAKTVNNLVSLLDIGPTILEAADIQKPDYLEGHSLLGYINNCPPEPQDYVFCEDNYLTMIRSDKSKLVYYTGQEEDGELYDLQKDPYEGHNVFHDQDYLPMKQELMDALRKWLFRSNYLTADYKNQQMEKHMLWPEDTPYLHRSAGRNPNGWYVK